MWQNIHPRGLVPLYRTSPPSGVAKDSDSTPLDEGMHRVPGPFRPRAV